MNKLAMGQNVKLQGVELGSKLYPPPNDTVTSIN